MILCLNEKLYEELLYDINAAQKTENNKIFIIHIDETDVDLDEHLKVLGEAVEYPQKDELK